MGQRHERSYVDLHLRFFLRQRVGQERAGQPETGIVHEQIDGEAAAHDLRVQIQGPVGLRKIGSDNGDVDVVACRNSAALASSLAASRADRMTEQPR
jgi:hypothetical protein